MKKVFLSLALCASFVLAEVKNIDINAEILENYQVIDVRKPSEWAQTGTIKNAIKISFYNEDGSVNKNFVEEIKKISSNKPIAIVCRSGSRSAKASALLDQNGIEVTNLKGGMNALLSQGYETSK
ncbi:rhodanese-like domain-containing protein [Campylobacter lari]|uniref:Putative rhodanese-related sulfurtransferase n=1 Tax=Campylobacter lari (strain RM2100 / D67 / ATCC BAA-1060) TaxID=306263 RepID=B9KG45_CAMLR|nr:rhodanese-like domain-containing protein [Campylobacter lari]ACM64030.1 putative rhodanese-related sulfurtransferase [Campylobacter lari RM2100]EAI4828110.1 rhodanese-like domain-containing protein [Campylobacter lari]EAI7268617.1 rhodanese-like domain-containing protein [Campylobacter lari]EAJ0336638.1 rhodanese-like domain-containing protein [Campylobacter lari]EAJ1118699.1 rhodanese-like domain-containing protein [Campylobacter lari]